MNKLNRFLTFDNRRMGQLNRFLLEFWALQKQLYRALSVFTCGVQRNQDDAGDATEHKKRLGREAESNTAQQLKRRRVGLGDVTWRDRSMAINFCCLKGKGDQKRTPRLDILTSLDVGFYREEKEKNKRKKLK